MGRTRTIARRTFLIGSAALAGGVAFGVYTARRPHENPLLAKLDAGEVSFNPWVHISPEKITLIGPHADKGQGIASSQAALIAEEMDLEMDQFEASFGDPHGAYWNTAMAEEGVPFKATDESTAAETMRTVMGAVIKMISLQGTGGSTSIPDSFDKLRYAGATARETLKLAASQQSGVPVEDLKTQAGSVILPNGTSIAYTELAETAASIDPVQDVTLRDPSEWRLIGKPMERLDIVAKSTGTLPYGIDLSVPDMLYATVRTDPCRGGGPVSFDATAAKAMRGVKDIIEITGGFAVIADNTWRAIRAANAIEVEWGKSPLPARDGGPLGNH